MSAVLNEIPSESDDQSPATRARVQARMRLEVLTPGPDRDRHFELHPLNIRPLYILTAAVKQTFMEIGDAIKRKRSSYAYNAEFRKGKSSAWVMIKDRIRAQFPNVAFGLVPATEHKMPSERTFWGELLAAHELPQNGTAQDRKDRFVSYVRSCCATVGGRHFVLFIDEGQNWGAAEYTWLRDAETFLEDLHKTLLTTVIVGDPKLVQLSDSFRATRKDLWSRFMMKPADFPGINGVEDLKFFMAEHDSIKRCEYPAGSGISYTEFFMPKAYANGWRLEKEAQILWDAYTRAAAKINRKPEDIGMQWVTEPIVAFLTAMSARDAADFGSDGADWDAAVEEACYTESLI